MYTERYTYQAYREVYREVHLPGIQGGIPPGYLPHPGIPPGYLPHPGIPQGALPRVHTTGCTTPVYIQQGAPTNTRVIHSRVHLPTPGLYLRLRERSMRRREAQFPLGERVHEAQRGSLLLRNVEKPLRRELSLLPLKLLKSGPGPMGGLFPLPGYSRFTVGLVLPCSSCWV